MSIRVGRVLAVAFLIYGAMMAFGVLSTLGVDPYEDPLRGWSKLLSFIIPGVMMMIAGALWAKP